MAPFALVGMAGGLALFWAVPFALARALAGRASRAMLLLAALWTLADYARVARADRVSLGAAGLRLGRDAGDPDRGAVRAAPARAPDAGRRRCCRRSAPGGRCGAAAALVAAGWGFGAWRLAQPVPARPAPLVVRLVQPNAAAGR